jgi:serine/threonine-protein kinase
MESPEPKAEKNFSHYRLVHKLGEGGMGVVYAAEDTVLRRLVAVKFLSGDHKRSTRSRFLREAQSASGLNHPNIATIFDYGETDEGLPYIVMEMVRGKTLSEHLAARALTITQSVSIVHSVLDALSEAHRKGVVHRDIKPSNIMIGERAQVKVLDFGLAKLLEDPYGNDGEAVALSRLQTQTLAGAVVGTPLYVSPEQATAGAIDRRSDLFSVGALLYECVAQRPAFDAPSIVEIFARIIDPDSPPPPSHFNRAISPELDRIILKALAKRPEERFQTADEFLTELRGVQVADLDEAATTARLGGRPMVETLYRAVLSRGRSLGSAITSLSSSNVVATRGRRAIALAVILAVPLLLLSWFLLRAFREKPEPIGAIAVIPFSIDGANEDTEVVNDGLTDSLIVTLSQLPDLKVISRNSVVKYKGQQIDPAEVGSTLNVQAILTGRMTRSGETLHIAAEFVDVDDGSLIWGGEYEKRRSDVFSLQQEIATQIAERIGRNFGTKTLKAFASRQQSNQEAYALYLKGRWHWNKRTGEGTRQAISYFQQAIDLEPAYALAYAGLADSYVLNSMVPPRESYMRSKAAAEKALQFDETLGEAHTTLGFIRAHYEKDWAGADREFEQAIALSPNYATAHHWYAISLLARGQFDAAFREMRLAQELDPLSSIVNTDLGLCYYYSRRYQEAATHFARMTELFPDFWPAYYYLGWTYAQMGRHGDAIEQYQKALPLSKGHTMVRAMLGNAFAQSGQEAEARKILKDLEALRARQYVSPFRFAMVYAGLGEKDQAFEWLNRANDELDLLLIHVNVSPFCDRLRDDPRFDELLRRIGLARTNPGTVAMAPSGSR